MRSTALLTVRGTLTLAGNGTPAVGAVATVKLVDADGDVLAATAVEVDGAPVTFGLDVDPGFAPDPSALLLWAMLRSDDGVWGTTELVPVTDDETTVSLTKIEE
jgi:putative lipoprotein